MAEVDELLLAKTLGDVRHELEEHATAVRAYLEYVSTTLAAPGGGGFRKRFVEDPRVKEAPSVARSLRELGLDHTRVWQVDDIIGARVVVVSPSDGRLLADHLLADASSRIHELREETANDDSGYSAIHLKGKIETTFGESVGTEIQIRTALQDAWAVVSRYDLYKRDDVPNHVLQTMRLQARHLSAIDEALELVRRDAKNAEVPSSLAATDTLQPANALPSSVASDEPEYTEKERTEEDFVLRTPVSPQRMNQFLVSYVSDRNELDTIERLFKLHGSFKEDPNFNSTWAAGIATFLWKGPFVEGSNWLHYTTREFATATERHLMEKLHSVLNLVAGIHPPRSIDTTWPDVLGMIEQLEVHLKSQGGSTTLLALSGALNRDFLVDLHKFVTPHWDIPSDSRLPFLIGAHAGVPILHVKSVSERRLFAVDVARIATLTRYGAHEFQVNEIGENRARELLAANPTIVKVPKGAPDTLDERVRRLRLFVELRLYESFGFTPRDDNVGSVASSALT